MAVMKYARGPAIEDGVSAVTATNSVELGTRIFVAGEEYVYCYNASDTQISIKIGCKLVTGASGYSVAVTSLTDVGNPCVGVVKNVTMTTNTYGWVMVKGFTNVTVVSAQTADYRMIAMGVDGKFIEASGTTTFGTATVVGWILGANTGAGGSAYAFIKTGF